ncbi:SDR family oxidoreductase [Hippea maritima]|uniref:Serine 3-dehydrogenase n=1 Tax=Hippea maritima (strain ATCC 700847 / DSM 10411 / MH2) TaxID=760142 RepID=F2LUH1_HIPMA|nr:SDR family oxidoreductase [Hippea maritima]AEA33497.1 Serine 3-dehydrogenase [Hippea maritima DSM 10411]
MAKVALITGASSGIGKATAEIFAKNSIDLIITARRLERLIDLKDELEGKYNIKVLPMKLDIRNKDEVIESLTNLPPVWRDVEILVNNAGLSKGLEKLQDGKINNWEVMIDTNIKGLLYATKAILPSMIQRNSGTIVNIASIAGHETYPGGNVYCATKAAVLQLSKALRMDVLGTNVRVISIDPGMVETEFSIVRFDGDKEKAKKVYENIIPLTAEDVAEAVWFAVSRPTHVTIEDMVIMPTQQASVLLNVKNYKKL